MPDRIYLAVYCIFCVSVNILEPYFEMQFRYLEKVRYFRISFLT